MFACPLIMGVFVRVMSVDWEEKKADRVVRRIHRRAGIPDTTPALHNRIAAGIRRMWCSACLNWKVVAPLAMTLVVLAVLSRRWFATAGPTLLALACPLSMGVAMFAMRRQKSARSQDSSKSSYVQEQVTENTFAVPSSQETPPILPSADQPARAN